MSCTVKELLDCAEVNTQSDWSFQKNLGNAQIKQYEALIEAGADDEDDVDNALQVYPHCTLDNFLK